MKIDRDNVDNLEKLSLDSNDIDDVGFADEIDIYADGDFEYARGKKSRKKRSVRKPRRTDAARDKKMENKSMRAKRSGKERGLMEEMRSSKKIRGKSKKNEELSDTDKSKVKAHLIKLINKL